MENGKYTVYVHKLYDGRMYIGCTCQTTSKRWGVDGKGYSGSPFYDAIQKYGWDSFSHIVLFENLPKQVAYEVEKELIKRYKTQQIQYGFNTCGGGNGWSNPTDEQKERFSRWSKRVNTGRKQSAEERAMHSRWMKENNPNRGGRCMTEERIERFREYVKKPKTDIQRKRMSASAKKRKVICVETGEVFESMKEAAIAKGAYYTTISCAVYDSNRRAAGYHWKTYE